MSTSEDPQSTTALTAQQDHGPIDGYVQEDIGRTATKCLGILTKLPPVVPFSDQATLGDMRLKAVKQGVPLVSEVPLPSTLGHPVLYFALASEDAGIRFLMGSVAEDSEVVGAQRDSVYRAKQNRAYLKEHGDIPRTIRAIVDQTSQWFDRVSKQLLVSTTATRAQRLALKSAYIASSLSALHTNSDRRRDFFCAQFFPVFIQSNGPTLTTANTKHEIEELPATWRLMNETPLDKVVWRIKPEKSTVAEPNAAYVVVETEIRDHPDDPSKQSLCDRIFLAVSMDASEDIPADLLNAMYNGEIRQKAWNGAARAFSLLLDDCVAGRSLTADQQTVVDTWGGVSFAYLRAGIAGDFMTASYRMTLDSSVQSIAPEAKGDARSGSSRHVQGPFRVSYTSGAPASASLCNRYGFLQERDLRDYTLSQDLYNALKREIGRASRVSHTERQNLRPVPDLLVRGWSHRSS